MINGLLFCPEQKQLVQVHLLLYLGKILHCGLMVLAFCFWPWKQLKNVMMHICIMFLWDATFALTLFIIHNDTTIVGR